MKIERYFPTIEPPSGGLQRLRARIDGRQRTRARLPAWSVAALLAFGALAAVPWLHEMSKERDRTILQLAEVRRILAEHSPDDLSVDGRRPEAIELESNRLEVFLVAGEPGPNGS